MDQEQQSVTPRIQLETPDSRVTVDYVPRRMTMHYVSDQEIDSIGNASNDFSLHLGFFGASISLAAACAITLTTVEINDSRIYFGYCAALTVSAPATLFFLIKAILSHRKARQQIRAIRGEGTSDRTPRTS